MIDYEKIALRITKLTHREFSDIHQCGSPSEAYPVNLFCEMADGLKFYVAYDKYSGWNVDFTRDKNITCRSDMVSKRNIRCQREVYKLISCLIYCTPYYISADGRCVVLEGA